MNLSKNIEYYFNKSPLLFMKTVPFNEIIFDERAKYMCKFGCKNYNRKYSCPPYSISTYKKIQREKYKWVILYATSYKNDNNYSRFKTKQINQQKEYEIQRISNELKNLMSFNGSKNIVFSGGSCKRCRPCSYLEGTGCKKPLLKQISMEAIQIDCLKTLTNSGFDFQLTDAHTLNRCGSIFTNDKHLSKLYFKKNNSYQKFNQMDTKGIEDSFNKLITENPKLYEEIEIIPIDKLEFDDNICKSECKFYGKNYSCPPYSKKIDLTLWKNAIIWKWKENKFKKYRYNIALKRAHKMLYSFGYYFAFSIRDCYCNECLLCSFSNSHNMFCQNRKILSPSMQSQGIDPSKLGTGKFGIELF